MKKSLIVGGILLLLSSGSSGLLAQEPHAGIIYAWNFESASPLAGLSEIAPDITVTEDPLDGRNRVMCVTLPDGSARSEVSVGAPRPHYFHCDSTDLTHGDELWVGFRILIPQQTYTGSNRNISIFQIGPIQNIVDHPGVSSKGHFQFQYNATRNKWRLREYASIYNPADDLSRYLVPVDLGAWENFVIHLRFRSDDQGVMEIWRNGVKIFEQLGPNGMPHARTRVKWGAYVGKENSSHEPFTCYFDDVRIGGGESSYEEVCPKTQQ